jgi:hypothetical protein
VAARDLLAAGIALRELEDERDLLGAAFLESVVPRPGAAEALELPEGLLVDGAPLHGIQPLDGASLRAKVPDEGCRQGQDEEQGEGPPGPIAVPIGLSRRGSGRGVHADQDEQPACHRILTGIQALATTVPGGGLQVAGTGRARVANRNPRPEGYTLSWNSLPSSPSGRASSTTTIRMNASEVLNSSDT